MPALTESPVSRNIMRYELPAPRTTLLGYVVRRMHKTRWLIPVPSLIAEGKMEDALGNVASYAVAASTSFGRAYYQPLFNDPGAEVSEPDPDTGAVITAKLVSTSPHYLISYTAVMPGGDVFSGSERISGTTIGLRGLAMPAPSEFHFQSGKYTVELTGILTSELVLSIIGKTRIRAFGFLNFNDNAGNNGRLDLERNNNLKIEINGRTWVVLPDRFLNRTMR